MAKNETKKEACPKCNGSAFAKATDKSGKQYCQAKGCGHVWVPGADFKGRPDVMIQKLQKENFELQEEIGKLRRHNGELAATVVVLEKKLGIEKSPAETEAEIFT